MTDYYVRKDGSDTTGDGSQGNPFLTIQHAIDQCDSSTNIDRVLVDDSGSYSENLNDGSVPGTPDATKHVVLKATAGNTCNGIRNNGAIITATSGHVLTLGKGFMIIEGFEIIQAGSGTSDECFRFNSGDNVISRCLVRTSTGASQQDGLYCSTTGKTNYADNCIIEGFGSRAGVHTQGDCKFRLDNCTIIGCNGGVASSFQGTPEFDVYNCLVNHTGSGGGSGDAFDDDGIAGASGVSTTWTGSNNIADDATAEAKFTNSYDSVAFVDTEPASGENAWFADLTAGDFRVQGTNAFTVTQNGVSVAAGDSRQDLSLDIAYQSWGATPQIGANVPLNDLGTGITVNVLSASETEGSTAVTAQLSTNVAVAAGAETEASLVVSPQIAPKVASFSITDTDGQVVPDQTGIQWWSRDERNAAPTDSTDDAGALASTDALGDIEVQLDNTSKVVGQIVYVECKLQDGRYGIYEATLS